MFSEFFIQPGDRLVAWLGLTIAVGHVLVGVGIKVLVNSFFKSFYDTLERAGDSNLTTIDLLKGQEDVDAQLKYFCAIAAVSAIVHPIAAFIRNNWTLRWRLSLVRSYLHGFSDLSLSIEGSSQRIQEDTQRFTKGIDMFLLTALDGLLTLILFLPVLVDLGRQVECRYGGFCILGDGWIAGVASSSATIAMVGALVFGRKLVGLEVANQKVEAAFRKKLVLVETATERTNSFGGNLNDLKINYERLYTNFLLLNGFLGALDQINVVLPYLLFARLLFATDPDTRILLGLLVQLSNSFDRVFGALSIVSANWPQLVEFQSVIRRLSQFEISLSMTPPPRHTHTTNGHGRFVELAELSNVTENDSPYEHGTGTKHVPTTTRSNHPILESNEIVDPDSV
jgi:peptide/bleomycin uptake transporter